MSPIRSAFIEAATAAADLLADPAVRAHWAGLSALPEFRVSGVAGHLALQVRYVAAFLAEPAPTGPAGTLAAHYGQADWIGAAIDDEANVSTRNDGEAAAVDGPLTLAAEVAAMVSDLAVALPAADAERLVRLPWADRLLTLDDFLLTRVMEIAIHSDDLAVSVGVATPALPPEVTDPVLALLTSIAARRHGALPLMRALSRRERAPESIAAF
ncbi:MAG: maleylpyruvate isomerase N-terminal domain-containing protein [Nakamurella sp.]